MYSIHMYTLYICTLYIVYNTNIAYRSSSKVIKKGYLKGCPLAKSSLVVYYKYCPRISIIPVQKVKVVVTSQIGCTATLIVHPDYDVTTVTVHDYLKFYPGYSNF